MDTVQKMKFSINDFFSKCDQIRRKLKWSTECLRFAFILDYTFLKAAEISGNYTFFCHELYYLDDDKILLSIAEIFSDLFFYGFHFKKRRF